MAVRARVRILHGRVANHKGLFETAVRGALLFDKIAEAPPAILAALHRHHGNRTRTAKDLGISRHTLWRKLKGYKRDAQPRP